MTSLAVDKIAGVILAGGRSSRMEGRDKALLPLAGKPMIERVAARLVSQVGDYAINANGDPERFSFLGRPVFADVIGDYAGPLAGVLSAMRWASAQDMGYTHVVTVAADTPFYPLDLVVRLAKLVCTDKTIALAQSGGNRHPVFALWPLALADNLETWLRDGKTLKVRDWIAGHDAAWCEFPIGKDGLDPFFNVNTPEDLAEAEAVVT